MLERFLSSFYFQLIIVQYTELIFFLKDSVTVLRFTANARLVCGNFCCLKLSTAGQQMILYIIKENFENINSQKCDIFAFHILQLEVGDFMQCYSVHSVYIL